MFSSRLVMKAVEANERHKAAEEGVKRSGSRYQPLPASYFSEPRWWLVHVRAWASYSLLSPEAAVRYRTTVHLG